MPAKKKALLDQINDKMASAMSGNRPNAWDRAYTLSDKELTQANRVPDLTDVVRRMYPATKKKKGS